MEVRMLTSLMTSFICCDVVAVVIGDVCNRPDVLRLGLLQPFEGELGFERTAAASTPAIEDAHDRGILNGTEVEIIYMDDGCNGKTALGQVARLHYENNVNAFVGLPCSAAAVDGGKLISYWNLAWFAFASAEWSLGDPLVYDTLVRIMSPYDRLGTSIVKLFNYYQWTLAALVHTSTDECQFTANAIKDVFVRCGVRIAVELSVNGTSADDDTVAGWLTTIQATARIVVMCGVTSFERQFVLRAHRMGMTKGEYVFIAFSQLPPDNITTLWSTGDSRDAEARLAFSSVLVVSAALVKNKMLADTFLASIPQKMAQPPWNYSGTMEKGLSGSKYSLFLYDAVYLFATLADKLIEEGNCRYRNGNAYLDVGRNWVFEGMTGSVVMDYKTDRIMDYNVWYLPSDAETYQLHMVVPLSKSGRNASLCTPWLSVVVVSPEKRLNLPADRPFCGFANEFCQPSDAIPSFVVPVISISILILTTILCVTCYFYRRRKFEEELATMKWKVKYSDLVISNDLNRSQNNLIKTNLDSLNRKTETALEEGGVVARPHLKIGSYNQSSVAIKFIRKEQVTLTREDLLELKAMCDMNNENLNCFMGMCVEPMRVCILTVYCQRGSLQDILSDDLIKLDQNFKLSFIGEIIKGMDFLHRSTLRYHGRLKTSNILIDSRWTVKITDWGLTRFRQTMNDMFGESVYSSMLWTSPEILRKSCFSVSSLQKADVYSFAVVCQEIVYREGPFPCSGIDDLTHKDIVDRIMAVEDPPLRPFLPKTQKVDRKLINIIVECWEEEPAVRPTFSSIKTRYFGIYRGNLNIMDNMLRMMEKYADNLEELVQERTQQLMEEKKKTDVLLYSMLPEFVAERLKAGSNVNPETFPEVSIYFSDIVSFTTLAAESSPMEVVSFLNDLYIAFDEVISKYNVYKVETIGDAYMVASGVPVPNSGHASEIARMSLGIRDRVVFFQVRHRPEHRLQIRIGIHSGPVVAGIVGTKMPRYCLFGDTVNTASRMESTGKAMRIHLSAAAHKAIGDSHPEFKLTKRGEIEVKGKGLQTTYWLERHIN